MKIDILALPAAVFALSLVSCENPADKTADASVKEAVAKSSTTGTGTKYVFTPESTIGFTGSKVTGKHDGGFKSFTGYFSVADGAPVGNDHKVVIDMTSTWSDAEKLTEHLKAPDFFDVEKFPETTFDVTEIKKESDTAYTVSGNFKLHGVEKNISFPATVSQDGDTVKIQAEFDINRKDFGILYPGKTDDLIRDEVVIRLDLQAKPEA
ncbi:YceI family protein [Luteolibacter marinus]|uniref:YceI family protein n=1 Tax=Luteolibacter marinus TaxID=2776705 RepID=UPI0018684B1F|nr:YceI family protein [Luteolibacter marinus]